MIDEDHLPYFITEDIYLVKETSNEPAEKPSNSTANPSVVNEPVEPVVAAPTSPPAPEPAIHELAIWSPPLTAADKELLVKILAAIKKDFHQAYLMQGINAYEPHYKKLLCFGYQKELYLKLSKSVSFYEPTEISGREILVSVSPAELHSDPAQKKRLWEALQQMFLK